jgi:hypothetical protein
VTYMPQRSGALFTMGESPRNLAEPRLHEKIIGSLIQGFGGAIIEPTVQGIEPDLLLRIGNKVVLIEVKTGDPTLPLPSSTASQMKLLAGEAQRFLAGQDLELELDSVLLTNYKIFPDQKAELLDGGIKVMDLPASLEPNLLASELKRLLGTQQSSMGL